MCWLGYHHHAVWPAARQGLIHFLTNIELTETLPSIFFSPSSIPQGTQTTRITSINSYILPASTQDIRKATDDSGSFGTIRAL